MGVLKGIIRTLSCIVLFLGLIVIMPQSARAQICPACTNACTAVIEPDHENIVRIPVAQHISNRFTQHRDWLLNEFFEGHVLPALMLFTEQMSSIAMHQTMAVGTFLDAKHQLETQRLLQELQVQAHKDYQPSEDFCWFGTNVRSLANSEEKSRTNAYILSRRQMARQTGQENLGGAESRDNDKLGRWEVFKEYFCDPQDSDWTGADHGLEDLCDPAPSTQQFTNADIDYTRLIENERTISLLGGLGGFDLIDDSGSPMSTGSSASISIGEQAVMALQNNLYGHDILTRDLKNDLLKQQQYQEWYMALRSVAAKRSVAENSFNAIVGMKSAGTTDISVAGTGGFGGSTADTYEYLGAILIELGIPTDEVNDIMGNNPSYYSQLEILAKRIYQNPDFYAGLYDKPANVKRKSVALKAIELMVDRAIYESQIRQEMLSSVLLSARLREPFKAAQRGLTPKAN